MPRRKHSAKQKTTEETYVAPSVPADPHLVALLRFILGDNGEGDYRDILVANAITATREILESSKSDVVINDECVSADETLHHTLNGVRMWLARPDRVMGDEKKRQLDALADIENNYEGSALDDGALFSAIKECADSGVLLGAALMYGVLKGGGR